MQQAPHEREEHEPARDEGRRPDRPRRQRLPLALHDLLDVIAEEQRESVVSWVENGTVIILRKSTKSSIERYDPNNYF